jgi:NAD-dependent dihydropyrimidine dehydrogenase PreA subunit
MQYEIILDHEKCDGCWECVKVCPVDVFKKKNGKATHINSEQCTGCESCLEVCQSGAINIKDSCSS